MENGIDSPGYFRSTLVDPCVGHLCLDLCDNRLTNFVYTLHSKPLCLVSKNLLPDLQA